MSDGAGAVVKSGAKRAVMGQNRIIKKSKDLVEFSREKLETKSEKEGHSHTKRTFFLVDGIDRTRPERTNTKPLGVSQEQEEERVHSSSELDSDVSMVLDMASDLEHAGYVNLLRVTWLS